MKEVGNVGSRERPVASFDGIFKQEDGYRKRRDIIGQKASNEATVEADGGCLLIIGHGVVCLLGTITSPLDWARAVKISVIVIPEV